MIELLEGFPPYVAAYKASGKVDREEYERIIPKRVGEVARQFGSINFLVRLETDIENYTIAALVDYLKVSFRHIHQWNRMAIVSDQKHVRHFYEALSPLVPGRIISFRLQDFEKAKGWVSEPFLDDENSLLRWDLKTGVVAGIVGTSAMTLFSDTVSKLEKRNFSEPDLLSSLTRRWNPSLNKTTSKVIGWNAHYAIGIAWALLYGLIKNEKRPLTSSLLFGIFSGTTGILVWKKAFALNPRPPAIDYKKFYLQLFFAHLIFSFTTQKVYSFAHPRLK